MPTGRYDAAFYSAINAGSTASARVVVPILQRLTGATSVLDVGCGQGAWLAVWRDAGVTDLLGVDGDYVDQSALLVDRERFVAHDLSRPLDLSRRVDLVTSFEVAEHVPAASAPTFVASLVRHADTVAFSAAIPGQGGTGHVNEQPPSYWARLFADHGYRVFDLVRPVVWDDDAVEVWYRQNLLLFATGAAAEQLASLAPPAPPLDVVHPAAVSPPPSLRAIAHRLPGALRDAARGRVRPPR